MALEENPSGIEAKNTQPVLVTTVAERKPLYTKLWATWFAPCLTREDIDYWMQRVGQLEFSFPSMRSPGVFLFYDLCRAMKNKDEMEVTRLIPLVKEQLVPNYGNLSDEEKWDFWALQMPGDWGPRTPEGKRRLQSLITRRATGRVLEAMCGFNSYIMDAKHITEVVAMDRSRSALERYSHPSRTRIVYDLERVCSGETISFFPSQTFQTVSVSFGVGYLSDPVSTYREFRRILAPKGRVLIAGGTTHGYTDLIKRWFDPHETASQLESVGFQTKIRPLTLAMEHASEEYYLVEGRKKTK